MTPSVIVIRIHCALQSPWGHQWRPFPHYRSLIDWKRCLCTISLVDRDQYSATGSSIRDRDLCECMCLGLCDEISGNILIDFKVKPSIERKDHILKGQMIFFFFKAQGTGDNEERNVVLPVLAVSYQQQHKASHTVTLTHTHTHLTANLQHRFKTAKSKEGSWSLASSSASLALRLQTTSLSICLIRADREEGE